MNDVIGVAMVMLHSDGDGNGDGHTLIWYLMDLLATLPEGCMGSSMITLNFSLQEIACLSLPKSN